MNMGYYIDLAKIALHDYQSKLACAYLPPSRMMLKENVEERFGYFQNIGINTVKELLQLLKKKDTFAALQKVDCLSGDYLTILLRELNSTLPKPNKIKDFLGISNDTVARLEKMGIKDTLKLFDRVINEKSRKELSKITGIAYIDIMELTKLTDLSRIKWVGVTFAQMLYELGVDTVENASSVDPEKLHEQINRLNKEKNFYKGHIGLNDMKIFVNAAKEIPLEIEY
jgi:hypothetical protein